MILMTALSKHPCRSPYHKCTARKFHYSGAVALLKNWVLYGLLHPDWPSKDFGTLLSHFAVPLQKQDYLMETGAGL